MYVGLSEVAQQYAIFQIMPLGGPGTNSILGKESFLDNSVIVMLSNSIPIEKEEHKR